MQHDFKTYEDTCGMTGITEVDIFAFADGEFCNGPVCKRCGKGVCHHCHPEFDTEECPG